MSGLIIHKEEPLYRAIEKHKGDLHNLVMDVMVGLNSRNGAPFFMDMYQELEWLSCYLFLEQNQGTELLQELHHEEVNTYLGVLSTYQDSTAREVEIVRDIMPEYNKGLFQRDLFLFLQHHRYTFFVKDNRFLERKESDFYNDPMHSVW